MDPELSEDFASLDKIGSLSITSDVSENVGGKSKTKSKRRKFVPTDAAMAKILDLLKVDLNATGDCKVKRKKGLAKVDSNWMENVLSVDWKGAFTEEGHLRLTCIFDMLPKLVKPSDAHYSLWLSYRRLKSAALGLEDYNRRHKDAEYYLVKPITSQPSLKQHEYVSHTNFLAKRKDAPESPVQLFFAEVFYVSDKVLVCCLLGPELYPSDIIPPLENAKFKRARVIYPADFECLTCHIEKLRYL